MGRHREFRSRRRPFFLPATNCIEASTARIKNFFLDERSFFHPSVRTSARDLARIRATIARGEIRRPHMTDALVLAHSPDSDDAFMFYGLRANAVDTEGVAYTHTLADIETLNHRALAGELAITAVSFHAYAYLADRYVLLPHGASFGDGYGPCVVARRADGPRTLADLAGRRVADSRSSDVGRDVPLALREGRHARRDGLRPGRRRGERGRGGRGRRDPRGAAHLEGRGLPPRRRLRGRVEGGDGPPAPPRRQRRPPRPRAGAHRARLPRARPLDRVRPRRIARTPSRTRCASRGASRARRRTGSSGCT